MAAPLNPRVEEVQRLADVEEKLRREKEQCESLEQQIRELARQTQSLVSQGPGPSPFDGQAPPPKPEDARALMPNRVDPPEARPPPPPTSAPPGSRGAGDFNGTSASLAAMDHGRGAAQSNGTAARSPPQPSRPRTAAPQGPKIVSALYRPAKTATPGGRGRNGKGPSSARRAHALPKGAKMTSWSQAPRFRDEKTWVPGPGKYNAEHGGAAFEPFQEKQPEAGYDGAMGHTWQEHGKKFPGEGSSALASTPGQALVPAGEATASSSRSASPSGGRRAGGSETQQLLDAALQRERKLKRDLLAAQRKLDGQMADVSQYQSQQRTVVQRLQQKLSSKTASLDSARSKLRAWKKALAKIEPAATELVEALDRSRGIFTARGEDEMHRRMRSIGTRLEAAIQECAPMAEDGTTVATSVAEGGTQGYQAWSTLPPAVRAEVGNDPMVGAGSGIGRPAQGAPAPPPGPSDGVLAFAKKTRRMSVMKDRVAKQQQARASQQAELVAAFGRGAEKAGIEAAAGPKGRGSGAVPTPAAMQTIQAATAGRSGSPPRRQGRRGSTGPHDVMVRRIGAGDQTVKAELDESPVKAKESTIDEKLRNIFAYYAMFGQRLGTGETISRSQFYKMVRDCRVLDNTHVSHSDVDIVVAREQRRAGETGRMSYETFIQSLTSLAARKYRDLDPARQREVESDPNYESGALRTLLKEHVLPIYEKLKKSATFVYDVVREGSAEPLARFNEQFLTQDTIGFFQDFDDAFQSIFMRFAMLQEPGKGGSHGGAGAAAAGASAGSPSVGAGGATDPIGGGDGALKVRQEGWQQVLQSHHRMTRYAFYKFCGDMKIMPDMLTRPQLTSIFREANRGLAHDDNPDTLCYPEFVELIAMIANHLYSYADAKERGGSGALPTLVSKVQYLLFIMHERGAKFFGDENRLVRHTLRVVKDRLRDSHREKEEAASGEKAQKMKKVANVLLESVYM